MKKSPSIALLIQRIQKLSSSLGGVFSYTDLFHVIGSGSGLKNRRMIKHLLKEKVIFKIQRGYYVSPNPDLWILACRLKKGSVISMDSVLARHGLIGTIPQGSVSIIYPGVLKRTLETPFGTLRYFSIKRELLFGFSKTPQGVQISDNEKAYLDLLYYHTKGAKFVIDPLHEVMLEKLDRKKIGKYLCLYKNPKFVTFVKGVLHGHVN